MARCVQLIASTIASCPIKVMKTETKPVDKEDPDGEQYESRKENKLHPAYWCLNESPNADPITGIGSMTSHAFFDSMASECLLRGNSYAEIARNSKGQGAALRKFDVGTVMPFIDNDGELKYRVGTKVYDVSEVLHFKGWTLNGYEGISTIDLARESIGVGFAAENYQGSVYTKGGPRGFLKFAQFIDEPMAEKHRKEWKRMHQGQDNQLNVGILSNGADWVNIGMLPKDADFLNSRKFQVVEIARWFGVPPMMLGDLEKATMNNGEILDINFVKYTLLPWVIRFEQELKMKLFTRVEKFSYEVQFNLDNLLRGDAVSRSEANSQMADHGVKTIDEWRREENLNPLPNGEGRVALMMGSQYTTVKNVIEGKNLKQEKDPAADKSTSKKPSKKSPSKKKPAR